MDQPPDEKKMWINEHANKHTQIKVKCAVARHQNLTKYNNVKERFSIRDLFLIWADLDHEHFLDNVENYYEPDSRGARVRVLVTFGSEYGNEAKLAQAVDFADKHKLYHQHCIH